MPNDTARWRRLESVVHAALARPAEERATFLAEACSDDSDLRREAESLLERDGRADTFLGTPLDALAAGAIEGPGLVPGQSVAHYRILEAIGAGGMGQVYAAEDTRLDRQVALKILPPELADDPERRKRFTREARALAALNHPNIVTVHAVEETDGLHFITMELVRGCTLTDLLPRHGFALEKFLEMAIPLTDALAAAHQQGITHRDVKPTNVMVTDDGRVKVLDFGLAKAQPDAWQGDGTRAIRSATEEGHIAGTPAYMSPEQAEGKKVDTRSDIFSLGIVFYELLTGQRPFVGDSVTAVLSSILSHSPRPLSEMKPAIPRRLARLVHRCLEKNAVARYQSAIDLRHDLEEIRHHHESGDAVPILPSPSRSRRGMMFGWGLAAVVVIGIVSLGPFGLRSRPGSVPRLQNPLQVTSSLNVESHPTWSPDRLRLAYQAGELGWYHVGDHDIWVTQVGGGEPVNLTKGSPANDRMPSWSPDGREIAFFSDRGDEWGLYIVAAIGGNPRKALSLPVIDDSNWSAPQWSQDGSKIFVSVREAGKNVVLVLSVASFEVSRVFLADHDGNVCWDLSVSLDDQRFAYAEGGSGATDITRLWTIPTSGGEPVPLTDGRTNVRSPTWSADGRRVFYVSNRGGSMDLWQQAVSDDGKPVGEPISLTQGLGLASAAFSRDGTRLAYTRGGRVANVWRVPIFADRAATWTDAQQVTSEQAEIETLDVSPDGTLLAISSDRRGNKDLWLVPVTGGDMTQLTRDPTPDWSPRWSPDGKEIAFYAYRSGNRDIWVMPAQGGPARQLAAHPGQDWYPSWSPDGREIAFSSVGRFAILLVNAKGGEPRPLVTGVQSRAEWFPDGEWLLVQRDGRLHRVARHGGEALPLPVSRSDLQPNLGRLAFDGQSLIFSGGFTGPAAGQTFWNLSLQDGEVFRVANLEGRRGNTGSIAVDRQRQYLYFTWREDVGDIWVMDVAKDDR